MSQVAYTKKARYNMDHPEYFHPENVAERRCRDVRDLASEIIYKKKYMESRHEKSTCAHVQAQMPRHKEVQALLSMAAEQNQFRKVANEYHLDTDAINFVRCRNQRHIMSDKVYKSANIHSAGFQGLSKDAEHHKKVRVQASDVKYKQELFLSQGKVTQISDEPWVKHHKDPQKAISTLDYAGNKFRAAYFLPEKW
jgi:hypothetical protein